MRARKGPFKKNEASTDLLGDEPHFLPLPEMNLELLANCCIYQWLCQISRRLTCVHPQTNKNTLIFYMEDANPPSNDVSPNSQETSVLELGETLQAQHLLGERSSSSTTSSKASSPAAPSPPPLLLICDLGYGLPKETRPRNEKMRAIARQLVTFLHWRHYAANNNFSEGDGGESRARHCAKLLIVLGVDETTRTTTNDSTGETHHGQLDQVLLERMKEVWQQQQACSSESASDPKAPFPEQSVFFTECSLEEVLFAQEEQNASCTIDSTTATIYLSPDSDITLDPCAPPPKAVVVGLLIDRRRIQVNRSADRASKLCITSARWPLECVAEQIHKNEPLNVDCVLEGMQQWHWNYYYDASSSTNKAPESAFREAATQAIIHHQERHPARPWHLETSDA